jgi:oxygen-independent coproporphyrinogen-3 oxidase
MSTQNKKLGIYIHIPFCVKKCSYCDFISAPCTDTQKEAYVNALIREIKETSPRLCDYSVDTVFLGGGTPSLLEAGQLKRILEAVHENYNLEKYTECTIECNPGTMTQEKACSWLMSGVNRISIGLQSANNSELKALGRIHTVEEFLDSFLMARSCGFQNINIDLMNALPYQTLDSFCGTLQSVAGLAPEHLSVYSLIVEENTPLYDWVHSGNEAALPSEEVERQMYYSAQSILDGYGYERYEISNYAKKGYECRHNLGYWERKEYAGFGLSSASLIGNVRYNNLSDLDSYIKCSGRDKTDRQILTREEEMEEFMFLGLRKIKGISKTKFYQVFEKAYDEVYGKITGQLKDKGLICEEADTVRLTKLGIDVSNVVMAEFLL